MWYGYTMTNTEYVPEISAMEHFGSVVLTLKDGKRIELSINEAARLQRELGTAVYEATPDDQCPMCGGEKVLFDDAGDRGEYTCPECKGEGTVS